MSRRTFEAWAIRMNETGEVFANRLDDLFDTDDEAGYVSSLYGMVRVRVTVEIIEPGGEDGA